MKRIALIITIALMAITAQAAPLERLIIQIPKALIQSTPAVRNTIITKLYNQYNGKFTIAEITDTWSGSYTNTAGGQVYVFQDSAKNIWGDRISCDKIELLNTWILNQGWDGYMWITAYPRAWLTDKGVNRVVTEETP